MNSPSPLLFTFAVDQEASPFRRLLPPGSPHEVLLTGIGPDRARDSLSRYLSRSSPSGLISAGFAGGLNPDLRTGDVVYDCSLTPNLATHLQRFHAVPGTFHSAAKVATTVAEKTGLRHSTGADAVDMESIPLRELAQARGLPCAIVRVVSDPANEALPLDFNAYLAPSGRLRWPRLLAYCLARPAKLAALLRLQSTAREAARKLATTLIRITEFNTTGSL